MKLQIIIPGKRLAAELPDEDAERRFADFVSQLLFEELPKAELEFKNPANVQPQKIAYYIECPHCGQRSGFKWVGRLGRFDCHGCHSSTVLDADTLAKIDFACDCGTQETYLTNITQERFDMQCFICRKPVPIIYDDKAERFGVAEDNQ